jgi:hypothetical protein
MIPSPLDGKQEESCVPNEECSPTNIITIGVQRENAATVLPK